MKFLLCNNTYINVEKIESISCHCTNIHGIDDWGCLDGRFRVIIDTTNSEYCVMEVQTKDIVLPLEGKTYCVNEVTNFVAKYCITCVKNLIKKSTKNDDCEFEISGEILFNGAVNELLENFDRF